MNNRLLTTSELSRQCNLKESWIRRAVFNKSIPFIRIGRLIRFDEREIKEWIEGLKVA